MEVYVVRHTPVAVEKGICYGQSDVETGADFEAIYDQIRQQLPDDLEKVYCSPLSRCRLLAEKLAYPTIEYDPALLEMNFGDWEGMKWDDIDQKQLQEWMQDFVSIRAPSGENLTEVSHRVSQFLNRLRTLPHQKVLLVTHSGVIRCIWAYLLHIPLTNVFRFPVGFGEVMVFRLGDTREGDYITKLM